MKMNDLDELHHFVNDLYERWDEGDISYVLARDEARVYCHKWAFKITRMYLDKYEVDHDEKGNPIFHATEEDEIIAEEEARNER